MNHAEPSASDPERSHHVVASGQVGPIQGDIVAQARRLLRVVYSQNPFYVISAALVFYGLRVSFDPGRGNLHILALSGGLAGYTLLLSVTAYLVIRLGHVWDDARSLLLLVLLMFLAVSVTLDDALNADPARGVLFLLIGLSFSVAVTEALLRSLPIKLPRLFRIPYYLVLGLFFLYPICLSPFVTSPGSTARHWALFLFPSFAGLVFTSLIPAIRRGAGYVRDNGTPWRWPWFPWTTFAVLAFGVCVRSYYLTVSFHFVPGSDSIFGLYFLVPFLFACIVILTELAVVSGSRRVQSIALCLPAVFLAMAFPRSTADLVYSRFLDLFINSVGSPVFLTLIGTVVFYAYAAVRRVRHALVPLMASLALLSLTGPTTTAIDTLVKPQLAPMLLLAVIATGLFAYKRDSLHGLVAGSAWLAAGSLPWWDAWVSSRDLMIPAHGVLMLVLVVGILFEDAFSCALRVAGAIFVVTASVAAVVFPDRVAFLVPQAFATEYAVGLAAVALGYWWLIGNRLYLGAALINAAALGGTVSYRGYGHLRDRVVGIDEILLGGIFFLLAALISSLKGGLWLRPTHRVYRKDAPPESGG